MENAAINISRLYKYFHVDSSALGSRLKNLPFSGKHKEKFYALSDVSLSVMQGEVMGIIGRNGAGKSTLLKLLTRLTPPSSGTIEIRGRVASILEIGIGFQPDLSGYDNIFLSASIYGLRKAEISKKIDSIIALFGFPEFLHTAVKYYSSGMYMRLAFSIIRHIDADIYLFDEILSVGDAAFQTKALSEIEKLKAQNATICIVTHNPKAIVNICNKLVLLEKGKVVSSGNPSQVLIAYTKSIHRPRKSTPIDAYSLSKQELDTKKTVFDKDISFAINTLEVKINKLSPSEEEMVIVAHFTYKSESNFFLTFLLKDSYDTLIAFELYPIEKSIDEQDKELTIKLAAKYLNNISYMIDFEVFKNEKHLSISYNKLMKFNLNINNNTPDADVIGLVNLPFKTTIKNT